MNKLLTLLILISFISCKSQTDQNMEKHKYTNSLIHETSPYLLQHAHNPVDWKAWNDETLELAKKENKLILISIGYSSCHWCHVMEDESFENEEVAAVMNQNFINIKIDREERPDIDQIYMDAVELMTGRGGWPLNCIALPDGRPVWGGTYFPKENWLDALGQISKLYKEKPEEVVAYADKVMEGIQNRDLITLNTNEVKFEVAHLDSTVNEWKQYMDFNDGGISGTQKFPIPNNFQFLLRYGIQKDDAEIMNYVNMSLEKMAYGGINDQVGGGFSRYSVDKKWHVPHFEKMLYDNGQLVSLYAEAFQATKKPLYKSVVYKTLEFIERELLNEEGGFYSSLDADSKNVKGELEEGAFYVWNLEELKSVLKDDFELFSEYYNVNNFGLWEHGNYVLIRTEGNKEFAENNALSVEELEEKVAVWQKTLLEERSKRIRPRLDDKSLTSWNAIMLKGYIKAYSVFNDPHFLEIAQKNAQFLYTKLGREDGGLNHTYKEGKSTINGYLEDYSNLIEAYIQLYEETFEEKWLTIAKELTDYTFDHFFDLEKSMFYFNSDEDGNLITRKIDTEDLRIPSSNSIMANNLFKLSHYYSNNHYLKVSKQMLLNMQERIVLYGPGYSNWLQLMANLSDTYYEIAISGEDALEKLKEINKVYIPNKLMAGSTSDSKIPLMEERYNEGETFIYVCVDGACKLPESEAENAIKQLKIKY